MNTSHVPLTNLQWQILEKIIEKPNKVGRKRIVSLREVINEILYITRTGVQWRNLRSKLNWQTVYYYFRKFTLEGTWMVILDELQKDTLDLNVTAIDSQSVRSVAFVKEDKGIDGNKKINGRKRNIWVDKNGLLLCVFVCAANLHDGVAGLDLLPKINESVRLVKGDKPYGLEFKNYAKFYNIEVVIEQKPESKEGFIPQNGRWQVERSFAWLNFFRRLNKDYEKKPESHESFVIISFIQMNLNKL